MVARSMPRWLPRSGIINVENAQEEIDHLHSQLFISSKVTSKVTAHQCRAHQKSGLTWIFCVKVKKEKKNQ